MPKPNFFIVGAPKCGTTAMYHYLKQHPDIYMPDEEKEPHFFSTDFNIPGYATYQDEQRYLSLFDKAATESRIGEASVWYLYSTQAAQNIAQFNPDAHIIIMLRNPADMLYSLHSQRYLATDETIQDFAEALAAEQQRKAGKLPGLNLRRDTFAPSQALFYTEVAAYTKQVKRYFDIFGRKQVKVIIFDDFKSDTPDIYKQTLQFLEVSSNFAPIFEVINANVVAKNITLRRLLKQAPQGYSVVRHIARQVIPISVRKPINNGIRSMKNRIQSMNLETKPRPPLDPSLRKQLNQKFLPEIEKLSELLDRDLTHWCRNHE